MYAQNFSLPSIINHSRKNGDYSSTLVYVANRTAANSAGRTTNVTGNEFLRVLNLYSTENKLA